MVLGNFSASKFLNSNLINNTNSEVLNTSDGGLIHIGSGIQYLDPNKPILINKEYDRVPTLQVSPENSKLGENMLSINSSLSATLLDFIPYILAGGMIYIGIKAKNQYVKNTMFGAAAGSIGGKLINSDDYVQNLLIGSAVGLGSTAVYNYMNEQDPGASEKKIKKLKKNSDEIPLPF